MDTQISSPAFELKYKIFFFNLVMLFFIMLVVTFLALEMEKSAFQDQTRIKGQTVLKSLEGILFELMIERDKNALDAIARKITSDEIPDNDIISAKLYDAQMSELASSEQASPMTGEASITTPSTLVISRPIKLPGNQEVGGIVQLYFSTGPLDARMAAIIRKNLFLTVILSLLNFFSAIVLANIIIRPVQSLVEAADKVSQGDLGMKLLEGGRDELGTLVTSFNRMVDSLRGHLEEIRTENRKLDRRVFELSTLHQATRMINSVLNLDRLFELIVDTTIQVLGGVKRCSIMLVDPRKNEFLIQNAKGLDVGLLPTSRRVPITQGIAGKVFATGESILINDLSNTETQILENAQVVRSSICVPVKCNEEVIGIISASNKISGDPFTNNDLNLLETLASQAGIAIKNARLYQDLDRKIFELATLHEVGKSLSMVLDIEKLLELILENTARVLGGVKASSLILYDEVTKQLHVKVFKGIQRDFSKKPINVGEGIAGKVFETGTPILINNLSSDEAKDESQNGHTTPPRSSLCVPLKVKEVCIGVLSVSDKLSGESFDENDLNMLNTLASQIAITLNNARLYEDLEASYLAAVSALANSLDAKDAYTRGHSERVAWYSVEIGKAMKLAPEEIKNLHIGALLHDIGKIGISENIINKPSRLTDEEFEVIKTHPVRGANIIEPAKFLEKKLPLIKYHHERFDGKGYPEGLKGEEIPLEARIVCVADSYDAMTSTRAYREPMGREAAIKELIKFSGSQFDSRMVNAFLEVLQDEKKITEIEKLLGE
jgi:HD-GYP domain-containing protein (c-di-GMP phosphodiesterase class II)/HAMP domain-containing protein